MTAEKDVWLPRAFVASWIAADWPLEEPRFVGRDVTWVEVLSAGASGADRRFGANRSGRTLDSPTSNG